MYRPGLIPALLLWMIMASASGGDDARDSLGLQQLVRDWAAAWAAGDFNQYVAYYEAGFSGDQDSAERWIASRRARIEGRTDIRIDIGPVLVQLHRDDPDRARTVFLQSYRSDTWCDVVEKTLEFRRSSGAWRIVRESVVPRSRC